jgi:hypothetical protein
VTLYGTEPYLFPSPTSMADHLVVYYLKKDEYLPPADGGAYEFTADENHRIYVFVYARNRKTGKLHLKKGNVRLGEKISAAVWGIYKKMKALNPPAPVK